MSNDIMDMKASELTKLVDLKQMADNVCATAKALCPVNTGKLRDSLDVDKKSDTEYDIGTDLEYAAFVEFGTSKMPPQPFLIPALEKEAGDNI